MTAPAVSILIVTYNSAQVIAECLRSVGSGDFEIIVIDNLSTDDTVALIRREFEQVRVIENDENAGFGRAVNRAAAEARGSAVLLLNPDAMIDGATIDALATELAADTTIGVLSPLLAHEGSELRIIAAGHAPTIAKMFLHQSGLSRLGARVPALEGHYLFPENLDGSPRDVDWTSGGCFLVPIELWRTLGGLSDRWFMYAEDVEFCLRVRSAGFRVVVDPRRRALHAMGGSSSTVDGRVNTAWIVNLFDLYSWRMATNSIQPRLWKAVVLTGMTGRSLWFRVSARLRPARAEAAAAQIRRFRIYRAALRAQVPTADRAPLRPDWVGSSRATAGALN